MYRKDDSIYGTLWIFRYWPQIWSLLQGRNMAHVISCTRVNWQTKICCVCVCAVNVVQSCDFISFVHSYWSIWNATAFRSTGNHCSLWANCLGISLAYDTNQRVPRNTQVAWAKSRSSWWKKKVNNISHHEWTCATSMLRDIWWSKTQTRTDLVMHRSKQSISVEHSRMKWNPVFHLNSHIIKMKCLPRFVANSPPRCSRREHTHTHQYGRPLWSCTEIQSDQHWLSFCMVLSQIYRSLSFGCDSGR